MHLTRLLRSNFADNCSRLDSRQGGKKYSNSESHIRAIIQGFEEVFGSREKLEDFEEEEKKSLSYSMHGKDTTRRFEPNIEARIDGRETDCFPDTGAGANYISYKRVRQLGAQIDNSATGTVKTADGGVSKTLGTVLIPFAFRGESKIYKLEFNVVRKCIRDIILGSPFLRVTETFTRFRHRVGRRLRNMFSCQVRYLGAPQQQVFGRLDGVPTSALPDTGSDIMLLDAEYARLRGYQIDKRHHHQRELEFADGSLGRTTGMIHDVQWSYDDSAEQIITTHFYVLEKLECNVLLSYDFLESTRAFTDHYSSFLDLENFDTFDGDWTLSTILLRPETSTLRQLKNRLFRRPGTASESSHTFPTSNGVETVPFTPQTWNEERRKLLQQKEEYELSLLRLPVQDRQDALQNFRNQWEVEWKNLMANQPKVDVSTSNPTSGSRLAKVTLVQSPST
jgi:hypothetical protein